MESRQLQILVLCTGNSCRSQMAEGLLRRHLGESYVVTSAGSEPKGVHPFAVSVMREIGLDISLHTSKHLREFLDRDFDYVITVCDNAAARCPTFPGRTRRLHWPFDDPAEATGTEEQVIAEFRRIRDEIEAKVSQWVASLNKH
ncbi:MAG: arsenate reductase ArsC [candidate division Zixibacteria bacterium]|nr:arsenate reductase ArsC [candidate division Zixibacteria bacterium]